MVQLPQTLTENVTFYFIFCFYQIPAFSCLIKMKKPNRTKSKATTLWRFVSFFSKKKLHQSIGKLRKKLHLQWFDSKSREKLYKKGSTVGSRQKMVIHKNRVSKLILRSKMYLQGILRISPKILELRKILGPQKSNGPRCCWGENAYIPVKFMEHSKNIWVEPSKITIWPQNKNVRLIPNVGKNGCLSRLPIQDLNKIGTLISLLCNQIEFGSKCCRFSHKKFEKIKERSRKKRIHSKMGWICVNLCDDHRNLKLNWNLFEWKTLKFRLARLVQLKSKLMYMRSSSSST